MWKPLVTGCFRVEGHDGRWSSLTSMATALALHGHVVRRAFKKAQQLADDKQVVEWTVFKGKGRTDVNNSFKFTFAPTVGNE